MGTFRQPGIGQDWVSLPQHFRDNGYNTAGVQKLFHPNIPVSIVYLNGLHIYIIPPEVFYSFYSILFYFCGSMGTFLLEPKFEVV